MTISEALDRLSRSTFRASFHLRHSDIDYINVQGMDRIRMHAQEFIRLRLAPAEPRNDGKQTPMKGHPVFVAMHACACCCRGCLAKWYKVRKDVPLTGEQQERIVNLLMEWIAKEYHELENENPPSAGINDNNLFS